MPVERKRGQKLSFRSEIPSRFLFCLLRNSVSSMFLLLGSLILTATDADCAVRLEVDKHVVEGEECNLILIAGEDPLKAGKLSIIYRPNSMVENINQISIAPLAPGERHKISWAPKTPGLVKLSYKAVPDVPGRNDAVIASEMVGVLFSETPASGLLVMVIAGFVLFGGCIWAFRLLTVNGDPESRS